MFVLVVALFLVAFYFIKRHYEYWERKRIPGPRPKPIVGNMLDSLLMKKHPSVIFTEIYKQYPEDPFVGIYRTSSPSLLVRDPELIKEVLVKSFDHFSENDLKVDKKLDPLVGRNPFFLNGEEWKVTRTQLTPAFTSGKMKNLYPLLEENSREMLKYIDNFDFSKGHDCKELCMRFTLNNVASCAFGLQGRCFDEENGEFRQIADNFLTPGTWSTIKIFLINIFPTLAHLLPVKITPKATEDKLTDIVEQTLKYREENKIVRNDFLHIMNGLKSQNFTNLDVTAHCASFFADGYESSSITMSFMLFAIASNPQVQEKLREEIGENFKDSISCEVLQNLPYLDAVTNEALRLYPPGFSIQKKCSKNYTHSSKGGSTVVIEKGTSIVLPSYGLQTDAKFFENPEKFDPERFLGPNKNKINKYTFLPFGEGPRSCLGQRFAMLQIKTGLVYIVKNFELSVNSKTQMPFKFDPTYFMIFPLGGIWLNFKKIV